jgi:ribosomal protein S12 methylthiotransferase
MKGLKKQKPAVGFVALGCPKNVVDSERMLAEIAQAGFPINVEANEADIIVINTCGFIAPAAEESLEANRCGEKGNCCGLPAAEIRAGTFRAGEWN